MKQNQPKIRFVSDYQQNAHADVMNKMAELAHVDRSGYAEDDYTESTYAMIRRLCACETAEVFYIAGGTLANLTVIRSLLRPHQGVVAADTGHIAVHETGAIEATGHKVLTIPTVDGKLSPEAVANLVQAHRESPSFEHEVQPGMVYISQPTELGTIYSKLELQALSDCCRQLKLPLFLDGARQGYALAAERELDFADYADLTDVFTIGGTKCGGLFGEAVVFRNHEFAHDFRYIMKQSGAMLAKGWLLSCQMDELLSNNAELYRALGLHGVAMAQEFRKNCLQGTSYEAPASPTNQLFVKTSREHYDRLASQFVFDVVELSETTAYFRICMSWSTSYEDMEALQNAWREIV